MEINMSQKGGQFQTILSNGEEQMAVDINKLAFFKKQYPNAEFYSE
ncbi:hypothetical protein KBA84_03930 [Patescibacteria group bacterium]|nr:hypothetical protein [Patescibacteria group bacterium]